MILMENSVVIGKIPGLLDMCSSDGGLRTVVRTRFGWRVFEDFFVFFLETAFSPLSVCGMVVTFLLVEEKLSDNVEH